jgi:hypothetical protein
MPRQSPAPSRLAAVLCVAFGVALTLAMQGYQFGKSNHTVYLIDALRHTHPGTLDHDWFATQTLQYHAAFGLMTRGLMTLDVIRPAFVIGHVGLAILLHLAWWRIVRALRGGIAAFVLSELLFHVSAGGTGLGMYQFLQDGAFLPSNIAAVAFLWAIYLWIVDRRAASAVMCGVAGLFHLNYAIVAPLAWVTLAAMARLGERRRLSVMELLGAAAMLELCLMNVVPAAIAISSHRGEPGMPLDLFIRLYVRLRHPHHYAPLTWPLGLWLSFLWPVPLAWVHCRRGDAYHGAHELTRRVLDVLALPLVIAFLGAGVWYVSETLVQLSLWRFSVFVKLLTCIGAAMFFTALIKRDRLVTATSAVVGCAIVIACVVRGPYLGFFRIPEDDGKYLAACDWIRDHTPTDAVFLVPPDEQEFRLRARRAIVVNYKCVPQLSRELPAWRQRLQDILMIDLRDLPAGSFDRTLHEIRQLYDTRSPEHLEKAARIYNARFIVVGHRLGDAWEPRRVREMNDATVGYFLYDLSRSSPVKE